MNIAKLSLAAIIALGSSAYALEDIKVAGEAKLWYQTSDTGASGVSFFDKKSALGQAALMMTATGKVSSSTGFGIGATALDTLGLENNLVNGVPSGIGANAGHGADNLKTQWWVREAYITHKFGNTLAKIGRQELNTPLAFTEKWNIASNTFDAAVLINSDVPNTTLIGAYVGKGNGSKVAVVALDGEFTNYVNSGAYAFAALNKSIENFPINLWYYNVDTVATAIWADTNTSVGMAKIGLQYGSMDPKAAGSETTDAFGVKVSGKVNNIALSLAYTDVSEGVLPVANTATGFKKTKLYTATVFSDGTVAGMPDTSSFKIQAKTKVGSVKLIGQYGSYDQAGTDKSEFDLIAVTKMNNINLKALYIHQGFDSKLDKDDIDRIRVIASVKF